jgi:hypothetical protein
VQVQDAEIRRCAGFAWCAGLSLRPLEVNERVEARFKHSIGGKEWYAGQIAEVLLLSYLNAIFRCVERILLSVASGND